MAHMNHPCVVVRRLGAFCVRWHFYTFPFAHPGGEAADGPHDRPTDRPSAYTAIAQPNPGDWATAYTLCVVQQIS